MSVPANVLNTRFVAALNDPAAKAKIAQEGQNWIRDKLREERFSSKVIPIDPVGYQDVQVSTNHDGPVVVVFIEPDAKAMTMDFRGEPTARLIEADRVEMGFFKVSSEMYQKPESELIIYQKGGIPVTKLIEDNSIYAIHSIEDREFLLHIEAAVQAMQAEANGVGAAPALNGALIIAGTGPTEYSVKKSELARIDGSGSAVPWPFTMADWVSTMQMIDGRRLQAELILFPEHDWDTIVQWTTQDMGSPKKSEVVVSGWTANELNGRKYARTNKYDVLRPGNIYAFTAPDYLGKFKRLTETKFYVDKIAHLIKWQCWEEVAMLIANVSAVVKMELYSGDATDNDTDSIQSSVVPMEEEAITPVNNRVASGVWYPKVVSY